MQTFLQVFIIRKQRNDETLDAQGRRAACEFLMRNSFADMTCCVTSNLLTSISLCSTSSFRAQFKGDICSDTVTAE